MLYVEDAGLFGRNRKTEIHRSESRAKEIRKRSEERERERFYSPMLKQKRSKKKTRLHELSSLVAS